MKFNDSRSALSTAVHLLKEIETNYANYLGQKDIPSELKVAVGMFIYLLRSSLDYAAYQIFVELCEPIINNTDKNKKIKKSVNFPIRKSENDFNEAINGFFIGLKTNHPLIFEVFEKHQPYNNDNSLSHLNDLSNTNKHKNLSRQKRIIGSRVLSINNEELRNVTIVNPIGGGISLSGITLELDVDGLPISNHPGMEVNYESTFVFTDLNISVISSIKEMLEKANQVIIDLELI